MRVTSPWIEEATPNQGSTCVKGRFGYDFPQHRDRLASPLIRKGWMCQDGRWVWTGEQPRHREGPWLTIEEMGERKKPRPPLRQIGKPPLTGLDRSAMTMCVTGWPLPQAGTAPSEKRPGKRRWVSRPGNFSHPETHGSRSLAALPRPSAPTRTTTPTCGWSAPPSAPTAWTTAPVSATRPRCRP